MDSVILKNQAQITTEHLRLSNLTSLVLGLASIIQEQQRLLDQYSRHTAGMLEELKNYDNSKTHAGTV
jgi:hypothetical protein